ncbi:MAG: glycosyltransferase, partial [Gaiella sp.]
RIDREAAGQGWTCFGGSGVPQGRAPGAGPTSFLDDAGWVSAWAPGWGGDRLPDGIGIELPRGSRIVMQVHYNLLNGKRPDRSRAVLTTVPGSQPLTPVQTTLLPAPVELPCAASERGPLCDRFTAQLDQVRKFGQDAALFPTGLLLLCGKNPASPPAGQVSTCDRRIQAPTTIHAVAGHMHLLGRSIQVELNPGTRAARHPALGLPLAGLVRARRPRSRRPGRRRARHLPPRPGAALDDHAAPEAALRAVGRGDDRRDVPGNPPGHPRIAAAPRAAAVSPPTLASMRILLVSQMYPGPGTPDLGVFVASLERELAARGHELERAVVDRRGGRVRHLALARDVLVAARRFRPDVVYAHFLFPAGALAVLAGRVPLVVTAHGQDVANAEHEPVRAITRRTVARAHAVVAVSGWLRDRLVAAVPEAAGKTEVIDCGVDLERFAPRDAARARDAVGWQAPGTAFLCLGSLTERKNVLRLARAFERHGEGSLAFVGDGPLRGALDGRPGIRLAGRVPHEAVPDWVAAADVVCQPNLVEPFGLATLEAMASARTVVATTVGGPPEFVPAAAGVLVDPLDDDALVAALGQASRLPRPNSA